VADEEYSKETINGSRLEAIENINKYQEQTRKWRDSQVVRKLIQDGDLVLRRKPNAANAGKLQPRWEGPYTTKATGRPGSFNLTDGKGKGGLRGTISEGHRTSPTFYSFFTFHAKGHVLFSSQTELLGEVRFLMRQDPCKPSKI